MAERGGFTEHYFNAPDGLKLYVRDYGSEEVRADGRMPVVCLAGLTRNSRDFHELAVLLSSHPEAPRRVVTIDTRGRGNSEWDSDPTHYNVPQETGDVIAGCAALGIDTAAFIGTSRGGLILHVLAVMKPSLIGAVILNDVGPAIGMEGLRLIQSYLGRRAVFSSYDDAVKALKIVHSAAFPAVSDAEWMVFAKATFRETDKGIEPDHDPAIAAAMAGVDLSQPLPELWDQFDLFRAVPLMAIRGENSVLLTRDILDRMAARNPAMEIVSVPGQGHAPILHLNGTGERIKAFLDQRV